MSSIQGHVLLALVCVSVSCNRDSGPVSPGPQSRVQIVPLAIGNTWQYHLEDYLSDSISSSGGEELHTITRDTTFNGQRVFLFGGGGYHIDTDSGYVQILHETWPSTIILLVYKYPTQVGDSVYQRIPQAVGDTSVFLYVTMATDTVVQTPAGSFPCIRYRSSSQDSVIVRDIYVSPGVGRVKTVLLRSNTTLARREESLVLYKLY